MAEHDELFWALMDERHQQLVRLLADLNDKVAKQNGRVGTLEQRVAVLHDRSPGRIGMLAGGAVAGGVAVVVKLIEVLLP